MAATIYTSREVTVRIGRQGSRPEPYWREAMRRAAVLARSGRLEAAFAA